MPKPMQVIGARVVVVFFLVASLAAPLAAQMPETEPGGIGPILQLAVVDLKVQGEHEAATLREAFTAVLPALTECLQVEYQRVGKVPRRITVRFNLGGNGKVVWCKLVDPPLKSLETCICKALPKLHLPPAGADLSRVTVVLESRQDHLLMP